MTTFLNQNLLGIKVVKAFVKEEEQIAKFNKEANILVNKYYETSKVSAFYSPFIGFKMLVINNINLKLVINN